MKIYSEKIIKKYNVIIREFQDKKWRNIKTVYFKRKISADLYHSLMNLKFKLFRNWIKRLKEKRLKKK